MIGGRVFLFSPARIFVPRGNYSPILFADYSLYYQEYQASPTTTGCVRTVPPLIIFARCHALRSAHFSFPRQQHATTDKILQHVALKVYILVCTACDPVMVCYPQILSDEKKNPFSGVPLCTAVNLVVNRKGHTML